MREYVPQSSTVFHNVPQRIKVLIFFLCSWKTFDFIASVEAKLQLEKMKKVAEEDLATREADLRAAIARHLTFKEAAKVTESAPAAVVRRLAEKIRREDAAIAELQGQVASVKARISALDEAIKLFPKSGEEAELRANSQMALVRDALKNHGKPMSLNDIMKAIGVEGDGKRNSLRGSLASYVREGRVFTRGDAPDTFGLIEFNVEPDNGDKDDKN